MTLRIICLRTLFEQKPKLNNTVLTIIINRFKIKNIIGGNVGD